MQVRTSGLARYAVGALLVSAGCSNVFGFDPNAGNTPDPATDGLVGRPMFGATVTLGRAPVPVSGGTLLVSQSGNTAVASDPDRDRLYVVDLTRPASVIEVRLPEGDEPGRLVEDNAHHVHVALRRGGALLTIDLAKGAVLGRRPVCAAPRGLAYDPKSDRVHVACAGGELVTFPAAGGDAVRSVLLDRDLRDVVVDGDNLLVSHFKSAIVTQVGPDGRASDTMQPPAFQDRGVRNFARFSPSVAWRMIGNPQGGALVVHQRGQTDPVDIVSGFSGAAGDTPAPAPSNQSAYGADPTQPCSSGIVHSTVTPMRPGQPAPTAPMMPGSTLPVDIALAPRGDSFAVVAAGNSKIPGARQILELPLKELDSSAGCFFTPPNDALAQPIGEAIAVAYQPNGNVVVQTREPATLQILDHTQFRSTIRLSTETRGDTGHAVFHSNSGGDLACASCHPEGGEDGRVWQFQEQLANGATQTVARRTQTLRGGILAIAPYHWDGSLSDIPHLVDEVFVGRMGGVKLGGDQVNALAGWLDQNPTLPNSAPTDMDAVERGRALFNDNTVACGSCHGGPRLTNNTKQDVGTRGAFQVPMLVGIGWRAPFIHDGCAPTLADRFGTCGGIDQHGHTSQLSNAQVNDLVAYLNTL